MQGKQERPIAFSGEMVRAILDGRKTQTRRPIKEKKGEKGIICRYGYAGDLLWVKETYVIENTYAYHGDHINYDDRPIQRNFDDELCEFFLIPHYRATEPEPNIVPFFGIDENDDRTRWSSSQTMPRWASRILLKIKNIKGDRLHNISERDAIKEGVEPYDMDYKNLSSTHKVDFGRNPTYRGGFQKIWDYTYGNWDKNPWVWVIDFEVVEDAR